MLEDDRKPGLEPAPVAASAVRTGRRPWRLVRCLLVIVLTVFSAVMSATAWRLQGERDGLESRLRAHDANSLLFEQQLDRVFDSESERWRRGAALSAEDLSRLQIWLTFDTAFAIRNRHDASLRFERAVALQRAGQCALLLGDLPRSIDHIQESHQLYEELVSSDPARMNYLADVARCKVLFAEAMEASGKPDEALRAYREAIALISPPEYPYTADGERLLSEWTQRTVTLSDSRSER